MRKNSVGEFFSEHFDIPLEQLGKTPSTHIFGNTKIEIENCVSIIRYCEEEISVKTATLIIEVKGSNLSMLTFSEGRVHITGIIFSYFMRPIGKYE